jgi:hypothetical protein
MFLHGFENCKELLHCIHTRIEEEQKEKKMGERGTQEPTPELLQQQLQQRGSCLLVIAAPMAAASV